MIRDRFDVFAFDIGQQAPDIGLDICPRGLTMQGVDKGSHKGEQAGYHLREDRGYDLTFLKQLRFSYGVSGVHGSAPSGAHTCISRPQKRFIHKDLGHVNEAKTVELIVGEHSHAPQYCGARWPQSPRWLP